ncbi:MAG: penicillin acylase family protein [Bryobacteraceae bacterium]|nr:penicillin acylase family protein [Bryobacteraceae bacterium]
MNRILQFINVLIVLALLAAGGILYWWGYRLLPQTSGQVALAVSGPGRIARDNLGVPHIRAASLEDAAYLQGYAMAQDRLWQMDMARRQASGEVAEVVGRAGLESDLEARRWRLRHIAAAQAAVVPQEEYAVLAAYARGVNAFIGTHRTTLPVEFSLLKYDPRPWSITDSLVIGMQMAKSLSASDESELHKADMLQVGDADKVNALFPVRSGGESQLGSNAWVVSGKWTKSGRPLLASDPHLAFTFPATWYQVHLEAPGLNVVGVTLPGIPMVIIGHNDRIAWGVTNLHFDVMDFYVERMNFANGQYEFDGKVEQARLEKEVVAVKDGQPVVLEQWITRHGPVRVRQALVQGKPEVQALALRWTHADPANFSFIFTDLNRAKDWPTFRAALARYPGAAQNFVYADVDGHIGYQATGRLPLRKRFAGDVPMDGRGPQEWEGFIPFDALPSSFDPPSGMLVTANQNPFPNSYPFPVAGSFTAPYRQRQIEAMLTARKDWTASQMLVVQKDVYSAFSHFLAKQVLEAYQARGLKNPKLAGAATVLRNWNGQMEKGTPAPLLVTLIYQQLVRAIADRAAPGQGAAYESKLAPAVVEKLLRERPQDWFADYGQLLLRVLSEAVDQGSRTQGADVSRWDYGSYLTFTQRHPLLGGLPLANSFPFSLVADGFRVGPVPLSGSTTTVKQTTLRVAPSMRFVADLSDWDQSLNNLTIGQSGQPMSSHFRDQWKAYYAGESFPLGFLRPQISSTLEVSVAK